MHATATSAGWLWGDSRCRLAAFDWLSLEVLHRAAKPGAVAIEAAALAGGDFRLYQRVTVPKDGWANSAFPEGFNAPWVRLRAARDAKLSAQFLCH